jgi:formate--tetrahydrofolate ligase
MEDINLHFTVDFSAVEKAHNLLAALIDNNIQNRQHALGLDPRTISWKRVLDVNDRALRNAVIGLGGLAYGTPRESGFDITAASEIMAILCLADDLEDLKRRMGNIFVGFTFDKRPVYARDLQAHGAMTALMKDAIRPNLVQTLEGNPAIIHGGPFANIAQGTNSVIATRMGLSLSDYVVTEAGFGFDLGAEKFFDIKCRSAELNPSAVVLVTTIRALKYHGHKSLGDLQSEDVSAVKVGLVNLEKHMENIKLFGVPAVVAINKITDDTLEEIEPVRSFCASKGVKAVEADVWGQGGAGTEDLAVAVTQLIEEEESNFKPLYDLDMTLYDKIAKVATSIYGAKAIAISSKAKIAVRRIEKLGLEKLPVCIAKTQKSLSDNPHLLGRPKDFVVRVRDIEIAAGAGFLIPITGDILRMPGLPALPAANGIDVDADGNISGMF